MSGRAGCKPLHLLQFYAVPRRVADDGVEPPLRAVVLPTVPHARERNFPVQKASSSRSASRLRLHSTSRLNAGHEELLHRRVNQPLVLESGPLASRLERIVVDPLLTSRPKDSRTPCAVLDFIPAICQRRPQTKPSRPRRSEVVSSTWRGTTRSTSVPLRHPHRTSLRGSA